MLIERIAGQKLKTAAKAADISLRTARKWQRSIASYGLAELRDSSSRPALTRSTLDTRLCQRIEQLRRARMPMRRIAALVGLAVPTVSRHLPRPGLSSLKDLDPVVSVVRYEHAAPWQFAPHETKRFGRIAVPDHRITGGSLHYSRGAGRKVAHMAIDDHLRVELVQAR